MLMMNGRMYLGSAEKVAVDNFIEEMTETDSVTIESFQ